MWVLLVHSTLAESIQVNRDNNLSDILSEDNKSFMGTPSRYLCKCQSSYSYIYDINRAHIFKTKSGAERFAKRINTKSNTNIRGYKSLNDVYLSIRRLTKNEFNNIIDHKIIVIKSKSARDIEKLIKQKLIS